METMKEKLGRYRQIIKEVLTKRAAVPYLEAGIRDRTLFDEESDSYAVISEGWQGTERIHDVVLDLEIRQGKVWIQADNTDVAVARELEERGIPKSDIVLGFRSPDVRPYTEYAVA
jgi:hypothetical protein